MLRSTRKGARITARRSLRLLSYPSALSADALAHTNLALRYLKGRFGRKLGQGEGGYLAVGEFLGGGVSAVA